MKLDIVGSRVIKNELINQMTPNAKVNLQVQMNHQIKVPNEFGPQSMGAVITKIMVGSPMHPLYMYMEQITNFADVEHDPKTKMNSEEAMSIFKMICLPLAIEKVEKTINEMCKIYSIPELKLQKNPVKETKQPGYMN